MVRRLRFAKRLVAELPGQLRLGYCLMLDPRVPAPTKALFAGAMGLIVTPVIDIPSILPFIGELDVLGLTLLALRLFIASCPHEVVSDQQQLIVEQRSRFDTDIRSGEGAALKLIQRLGLRRSWNNEGLGV